MRYGRLNAFVLVFLILCLWFSYANCKGGKDEVNYNSFPVEINKEKEVIENVLTKLYTTAGIYRSNLGQPSIRLTSDEQLKIALYDPEKNEILISTKVIEFANTQNENFKSNIYVVVVGHELGHYFLFATERSYSSHHSINHASIIEENEADFYSVFTAMLAGYKGVKNDVGIIIESLYDLFELEDEIYGYPSKKSRIEVAEKAIHKSDSLFQLFQLANYLTAAEKYEPAIEIYDHLLQYYGGAEFYNNRGILLALLGVSQNYNSADRRYKRYFFPLELDLKSKLENVRDGFINRFLTKLEVLFFDKAIADFDKAIELSGGQERYYLNKISASILKREYDEVEVILKEKCLSDGDMESLLNTIIKALTSTNDQSVMDDFDLLINNDNSQGRVALLAKMNKNIFTNTTGQYSLDNTCSITSIPDISIFPLQSELNQIPTFSISNLSDFQYGWSNSQDKGNCFVIKKDNAIVSYTISIPTILSHEHEEYLPSTMGLNFFSCGFSSFYGKGKIIVLDNGDTVVMR